MRGSRRVAVRRRESNRGLPETPDVIYIKKLSAKMVPDFIALR